MRWKVWVGVATLLIYSVMPAVAEENGPRFSFGYAHLQYWGDDGGNAQFGLYLSIAPTRGRARLEVDVGYHHDQHPSSENLFGSIAQDTLTIAFGPRLALGSGRARPYLHVLGGLRHDTIARQSSTWFGGMAGGGVDVLIARGFFLRLGSDFQAFFDEGEALTTLRLSAGFSF
jgi:hypothetical protein